MSQLARIELAAEPGSAAEARRFVREHVTLDSMRHTEADLLTTELVGNVVRHGMQAESFVLEVDQRDRPEVRVNVSHRYPGPLNDPEAGVGFTLIERISQDWGYGYEKGTLTSWFTLRRPGSVAISADLSDGELFERLEEDPAAYSDELVRRHRDLAVSIAQRYRGKGIPNEDLEQVALMALLKAIQRFDPSLGDIRPYATATISGEMKKHLRDRAWAIRVPRSVQERSLQVSRAAHELTQSLKREAGIDEIARHLDLTQEEVAEAMGARLAYTTRSIEQPTETTGSALLEQLEDPSLGLFDVEDQLMLTEAISRLPARQRKILDLRFNHDMTQSEIAATIGISQMHVSRLLSEAIETLRSHIETGES